MQLYPNYMWRRCDLAWQSAQCLDDRVRTQKHFIPSIYKKLLFTAKANRRSTHRHSGASPPAVSGFAVLTLRQPEPRQHRACPADRPTAGTAGGREGGREDSLY